MSAQEQVALVEGLLRIDPAAEVGRITSGLRETLRHQLRRRGFVVAISGGVDSSVCAALCAEAVGADKVLGLMLPENDSSGESEDRARQLADRLGIPCRLINIAATLEALGCYRERDEAMRRLFPDYGEGWKSKIVIRGGKGANFSYFALVVMNPSGETAEARLSAAEYRQIVAATNYKQRVRKTVEYFHADRLNYAVVGTPNRLEFDQGFFVKNGDGSADVKPIAHLYKGQVYLLARHLGLPDSICDAVPTTDTYSMPQGQDEFYFTLPYQQMDAALALFNHGAPVELLAEYLGLSRAHAAAIYEEIVRKRQTTAYLHRKPVLLGSVEMGGESDTPALAAEQGWAAAEIRKTAAV